MQNETTKLSFEKFSNFVLSSLSKTPPETINAPKRKNEFNDGFF